MKKILIIAVAFLFVGCASKPSVFFGIEIKDMDKLSEFTITSYSDSTGVSFKRKAQYMNSDISAFGRYMASSGIKFTITNDTSRPLFSNYFLDEFLVTDYSGNVYILTKQEITAYPDGDINPKQEITFKFFDLPIDREQIMMIAVNLGGRNNIVLKRIPKPKIPE